MMFKYTIWYRRNGEARDRQKSFRFADDAAKWLDARCDTLHIVEIYRHDEIRLDELIDDAWQEFGERSS